MIDLKFHKAREIFPHLQHHCVLHIEFLRDAAGSEPFVDGEFTSLTVEKSSQNLYILFQGVPAYMMRECHRLRAAY